MQGFWAKLQRLIRWGSVVRDGKDDKPYPIQQVRYMDKVADTVMLFPYGMHANVDGESLGPMFIFGGSEEDRAMLATSMTRRSALKAGEVEIYSPVTRSRVTFKADESIEVEGKDIKVIASGDLSATVAGNATADVTGDVTVDAGGNLSTTVGGNVTATITGTLTATAASAQITAATVGIVGNMTISGTLAVTGALTQGGTDVGAAHTHSGVTVGAGTTGPVV